MAWSPDVIVTGANGLCLNYERRQRHGDYESAGEQGRRCAERQGRQNQAAKLIPFHISSFDSYLHPQQREREIYQDGRTLFAAEMPMLGLGELKAALETAGAKELTGLLRLGATAGAFEQLLEAIYPELRQIAPRCLSREREGLVEKVIAQFRTDLQSGCLVTVKSHKTTCHRLPIGGD